MLLVLGEEPNGTFTATMFGLDDLITHASKVRFGFAESSFGALDRLFGVLGRLGLEVEKDLGQVGVGEKLGLGRSLSNGHDVDGFAVGADEHANLTSDLFGGEAGVGDDGARDSTDRDSLGELVEVPHAEHRLGGGMFE